MNYLFKVVLSIFIGMIITHVQGAADEPDLSLRVFRSLRERCADVIAKDPALMVQAIETLPLAMLMGVCNGSVAPTGSLLKYIQAQLKKRIGIYFIELKDPRHVMSVAFNSEDVVATRGFDALVYTWDAYTGQSISIQPGDRCSATPLAYSSDRSVIAARVRFKSSVIGIYDANTHALLDTVEGHKNEVQSIAFSPNGSKLVSTSFDEAARVWTIDYRNDLFKLCFSNDELDEQMLQFLIIAAQDWKNGRAHKVDKNNVFYQRIIAQIPQLRDKRVFLKRNSFSKPAQATCCIA